MKLYVLAFISFIFSFSLLAQIPDYDVEVLTAAYADLDNPTQLVTEIWDDPLIELPIPFPFIFLGETLSELSTFNGVGMDFFNANGTVLFAYPSDLIDRGTGTTMSLSTISSQLTGTMGNRILKLEWKNAGFYSEIFITGEYSDFVNIQLWLYEADNAFEIRFGPSKTDQPIAEIHDFGGPTCGYGTIDTSAYTAELWTLEGDPLKPEQVYTVLDEYNYYDEIAVLTAHPADGTVYRYTPSTTVSTEEIKENTFLTVFPTKVAHEVHLKWNQEARVDGEIQVMDVTGKVHYAQSLSEHLTTINCDYLSPGLYFLRWRNEEGMMKTFKFVKN